MVVCVCVCVLLCVVGGTCYGQASPQARHASKALAAGLLPPGDDGAMHRPAAADCRCRCRALPARPPQVPDSCASSTSSPCNAVPSLPSSAPRGGGPQSTSCPRLWKRLWQLPGAACGCSAAIPPGCCAGLHQTSSPIPVLCALPPLDAYPATPVPALPADCSKVVVTSSSISTGDFEASARPLSASHVAPPMRRACGCLAAFPSKAAFDAHASH